MYYVHVGLLKLLESFCFLVLEVSYGSFDASDTESKKVLILGSVTFLTVQILFWYSVRGDLRPMCMTPAYML